MTIPSIRTTTHIYPQSELDEMRDFYRDKRCVITLTLECVEWSHSLDATIAVWVNLSFYPVRWWWRCYYLLLAFTNASAQTTSGSASPTCRWSAGKYCASYILITFQIGWFLTRPSYTPPPQCCELAAAARDALPSWRCLGTHSCLWAGPISVEDYRAGSWAGVILADQHTKRRVVVFIHSVSFLTAISGIQWYTTHTTSLPRRTQCSPFLKACEQRPYSCLL